MTEIKRLNYFTSQFLVAQDFIDEQVYHKEMRRLHNRRLHSWGIVEGLEVTKAKGNDRSVVVSPGLAIDSKGREIVVAAETSPESDLAQTRNASVYVTAEYDEVGSNPTGGNGHDTRWKEVAKIAWSDERKEGGSVLLLAEIKTDGKLDTAVRRYAGLNPNTEITKLTVTGDANLKQTLTVEGDVQAGAVTAVAAAFTKGLTVEGAATFKKGLTVEDAATFTKGLTVEGDVQAGAVTAVTAAFTKALTVEDAATFKKGLTVEDAATFKKGLTVEDAATFKKGLTQEDWKLVEDSQCISPWGTLNPPSQRNAIGAAYFKDSLGMVHLRGALRFIPTREIPNAVSGEPLFQLPAPYRPGHDAHCATVYGSGVEGYHATQFAVGRVEVKKDGNIILHFTTPTAQRCFLDGITFRAAS